MKEKKDTFFVILIFLLMMVFVGWNIKIWNDTPTPPTDKLINEPFFIETITGNGFEVEEINEFTAEKEGSIWKFYLLLVKKDCLANPIRYKLDYWKHRTNGYVYYDPITHEIVFDLVKFRTTNLK